MAGLMVCPFAILLSLSGSIYLFKPQIDNYEETTINALAPVIESQSSGGYSKPGISGHIKMLLAKYPEADFKRVILSKPGDRSLEIELQDTQGEKTIYWIDSLSGQVLISKNSDQRFMQRVKNCTVSYCLGIWVPMWWS